MSLHRRIVRSGSGSRMSERALASRDRRLRAAVSELLAQHREKLFQQFSSAEDSNPLSAFQRLAVGAIRQSSDQQHQSLREMNARLAELRLEIGRASCRERV